LGLTQGVVVMQERLGLLSPDLNALTQLSQSMFGVTDQLDEDFALASALAAEAAHDLLQGLAHRTHLGAQGLGRWGPLTGDTLDEAQHFFWALYSVVASVTRWLPCSEGKVSTSRWAGLTSPSSIAAAAWIATSASIKA